MDSGDPLYVKKVMDALGSRDVLIQGAAKWSLSSNMKQHELVDQIVIPIHFQKKANRLRHAGQSEQRERRSGIQRNCQKAQPFAFIFFKKQRIKRFAFWDMCWIPSGRSLRSLVRDDDEIRIFLKVNWYKSCINERLDFGTLFES